MDEALITLEDPSQPVPENLTLNQLISLARTAGEQAVPALRRLTAEPALRVAALEALGHVRGKEAANALFAFNDDPARDVRKMARRSLIRLRAAGIVPDPVQKVSQPAADPILIAVATAFSLRDYSQIVRLLVRRPYGKRQTVAIIRSEIYGIISVELGETTRSAEDYRHDVRDGRFGEVNVSQYEIPVDYARSLVRRTMRLNSAMNNPLPADIFEIADLFPASNIELEPPIQGEIRPIEVKLKPELLEQSERLLDEPEASIWLLDPRRVAPVVLSIQEGERSALMLGPEAERARTNEILEDALRLLFSPVDREAFRHVLEETAWCFYQTDRLLSAQRAIAVATEIAENPASVPAVFRLILANSVATALGRAPIRRAQSRGASGLWVPG